MTAASTEAQAPAGAPRSGSWRERWPLERVLPIVGIGAPMLFLLIILSGMIANVEGVSSFPFVHIDFQFPVLFRANTPTGGDMGAHVLLPQYLRDNLLPEGRLFGWSNDWYAGYPALYFYFPLPALTTVLLDVLLPYGVAFKLTTILGLLALPGATFFFVRCLNFDRVVASIAAVSGTMFVFMESYSIFGANIKSTMAGEFSFSWSFALSLIYLGLVTKSTREGKGFTPAAGVFLALTALTHIVTTMVVVAVSLPLLLRRRGTRTVGGAWLLGFSLAAFWALPLGVRVLQGMTTDMGWAPVENIIGDTSPGSPLPDEFIPVVVLGLIGMAWTLLRRNDVVILMWLTALPLAGYFILPGLGITALYNARLLPYWYFGMYVFAGLALGLGVVAAARAVPQRRQNMVIGAVLVLTLLLNVVLATVRDVPGWVRWNYSGYEGKTDFAQYEALMETVGALPAGRVMWEANNEMNKYGTPMALMLFPYWSDDHPSMEGLFFESSLTTPFHFLNASEMSLRPSNPVRGLRYRGLDFTRGIPHLAVYNVDYYVSYTPEAAELARGNDLVEMGTAPPWTVFKLPESSLVDVARFQPAVYTGDEDFLDVALEWYDDVETLDHWVVADGPVDWPTVDTVDGPFDVGGPIASAGEVSDILLEDQRISFHTTAVGVPHLVKVSYFPNWTADGAEGPYRAAPSLMVVVPTQEDVVIEFRNTWPEDSGIIISLTGVMFLAWWTWRRRKHDRIDEGSVV